MEPNTTTYKAMYEGSMIIEDPAHPTMEPYVDYSSTYYNESIGFDISITHKLAQDKPTVVISIPCATLGIDIPDKSTESVEADFCLRAFKKYVDELNAELYNRSRPDNENGKYYLCTPGGEIIKRNTAYFALCPQKDYTNGSGSTVYLLNDGVSRPPLMCLCIRIQVQFPLKKLRKTLLRVFILFLVVLVMVLAQLFTMDGFAVDAQGVVSMEEYKYLINLIEMPAVLSLFLVGAILLVAGVVLTLLKPKFTRGIWLAGPGTVLVVMALFMLVGYNGTAYYPSNADLQSSLTLQNSSSSQFTLTCMSIVSLIIPFVVAYIAYFWRKMDKGSLTKEELNQGEKY